ncbi:MAG: DUF2273 domain-containing protein [Clostridia bacterium]|nr:DUF2273 domain-containing protein [Clostridia bacterium]
MSNPMIKRLVGAAIGVAIAVMMLFLGFWKTLLIVALAAAGWWLAGSRKVPQVVLEYISRIFHLN